MKKALLLLPVILMTLFIGCEQMKEEEGNLNPDVTTVEQQIEEIKGSLPKFRAALESLKSLISDKGDTKSEVETKAVDNNTKGLKQYVELLEERIEALEEYVYSNDDKSKDWLEATYATLEMYQETVYILALIQSEIEAMKANMENIDSEVLQKAEENISESITSMKDWVNERLTGYYDIVAIDAKFAIVEESLASSQTELHKEISDNRDALKEALASMEVAYKDAIKDAIEKNNGVIDTKIANAIADVNARIDKEIADINKKLSDLEDRISKLESSVTDLLNRIQSIAYIPLHEDNKARVNITKADMRESTMDLDFKVSPRSAISDITEHYSDVCSIKVLTEGNLNHIELPIISCSSDLEEGLLHLTVDCQQLGMRFFYGKQACRAILYISDGNNDLTTEYFGLAPIHTNNLIFYKTVNNDVEPDAEDIFKKLGPNVISTEYSPSLQMWVTRFEYNFGEIPAKAFQSNRVLTDIIFSDLVETIQNHAFSGCSYLKSIESCQCIDSHRIILLEKLEVKTIGAYAFENTKELHWLTLSDKLESIGAFAFQRGGLSQIIIPNSVKTLGAEYKVSEHSKKRGGVFSNCEPLGRVTLPEDLSKIEDNTFDGCKFLYEIKLPESIDSIGKQAFRGCTSLPNVKFPEGTTSIEAQAFSGCSSLTHIYIPEGVTTIGTHAFNGCSSLTGISIPEGVTSIRQGAFYGCTGLTEVTIPGSVVSIGAYAFDNTSIHTLYIKATTPPTIVVTYRSIPPSVETIYVPRGRSGVYKAEWSDYANKIKEYNF